ncbi:phosphoserine phosphatase SerB [Novosphingobium sp.]|uniref:phosphoserine phosphatase SerB n=1 Tax=Novosphingobium sp. TaxID=1874826 RepID=UPI00333F0FA2
MDKIEDTGAEVLGAGMLDSNPDVLELEIVDGDAPVDAEAVRRVIDAHFGDADMLLAAGPIDWPRLFVSDMDSTMIGQECIDELADFAGLKDRIAAITERAMRGELDFAAALHERVALLAGLSESAIADCLDQRIRPTAGAATLVRTLKALGAHTVLVTGGFHAFADTVGAALGFDRVVANHLGVAGGVLTGVVTGDIVDNTVKRAVLIDEAARIGEGTVSLAAGDGANDIPMIRAATHGIAFRAKPTARAAAHGRVDRGDLTAILDLYGISRDHWVTD